MKQIRRRNFYVENFKKDPIGYVLSHYPIFEIGCLLNGIVWGYIIGKIIGYEI